MKNIKFMALISPLILCGCSSTPKPTVTTYAVVLESGEGTFPDSKTYLILNNISEGTPLNEVAGYIIPTKDENHDFDNWLDDEGNVFTDNTLITANMHLTASYTESIKYLRETYIEKINSDVKDARDYSIIGQKNYNIDDCINLIQETALDVINDKSITHAAQLKSAYIFAHACLEALYKADVSNRNIENINEYYPHIKETIIKLYNYKKYVSEEKIRALDALNQSYLFVQPTMYSNFDALYQEQLKNLDEAFTSEEISIVEKIGSGALRGCGVIQVSLTSYDPYNDALNNVNQKLSEAKKKITDKTAILKLIDYLGDYATVRCKLNIKDESDQKILVDLDTLWQDKILTSVQSKDSLDIARFKILTALMKGDSHTRCANFAKEMLQLFTDIIEPHLDKKTPEVVDGITQIVTRGSEALQQGQRYATNANRFIDIVMTDAINYYIESNDFLSCSLCAMDVAKELDLPSKDIFIKQCALGAFSGGGYYYNYDKIITPLEVAYELYKSNIEKIPERNREAFKIVINGIIKTSIVFVYRYTTDSIPLNDFISKFNTHGLDKITGSMPMAYGFAHIFAGIAYTYVSVYTFTENHYGYFNTALNDTMYTNLLGQWNDLLGKAPYIYIVSFIGETVGTYWQESFIRAYQPPVSSGRREEEGFNLGINHMSKYVDRVSAFVSWIRSKDTLVAVDSILSSLNSSRYYHYYETFGEDWAKAAQIIETYYYQYLDPIFNELYVSSTPKQFIDRTKVYFDCFIDPINRQNNNDNFANNLEELQQNTIKEMKKVDSI